MLPTCSVLLDLDGTLIDSQPGILASCRAALRALGHEPDETLDIKRAILRTRDCSARPEEAKHVRPIDFA
jgi:phosphoglycolate phosphatase-like HAD superfamily hydrolase